MIPFDWKWYRKWRGGRWATVGGWFWGRQWISVPPECVERVEEDYTSKVVPKCRHGKRMDERCGECRIAPSQASLERTRHA